MSRPRIDQLLRLMNDGFEGGDFSLLANLGSVDEASWEALPEGGHRSIRELTAHVGMFKFMYANHAFRDASFNYLEDPATPSHGHASRHARRRSSGYARGTPI